MKILLDTHVFLWYISGDQRLTRSMLEQLRQPANEVYLSVVSLWEIIIKYQIGKMPLPQSPEQYIPQQRQNHMIGNLDVDVDVASVRQLITLPTLHNDPFDRLLICQAINMG